MNLNHIFKSIITIVNKNAPTILTAIGAAGVVGTAATAIELSPKAKDILDDNPDADGLEKVQLTWKYYLPIVAMSSASICCMAFANHISLRRYSALGAAYLLKETDFNNYKEEAEKLLGKKKTKELQEAQAKKAIESNPIEDESLIWNTGNGNTLCYDYYSGRYFRSSIEAIKKAQNYINERILKEDKIFLNDVYDELSLPHIGLGDHVSFNMREDGMIEFAIESTIAENDQPCVVLDFKPHPSYNYVF